jgi:uncharacterized alkaline shock family protein YloU
MQKSVKENYADRKGKTTIAPEVLLAIARLTALNVAGVARMSDTPGSVNRWLSRGVGEGVRIQIRQDVVYVDLYIVLKDGVNFRNVSRQVQQNVSRAISEMVGMRIGHINIHIEDIDFPEEPASNPEVEG